MDGQTLAAAIAISRGSGGGSFAPDITDPQDGDTLVYDASEEKWVNGSGGSGGGYLKVVMDANNTLDKTWNEIKTAIQAGFYVSIVVNNESESESTYQQAHVMGCSAEPPYGYYLSAILFTNGQTQELEFSSATEDDYPTILT